MMRSGHGSGRIGIREFCFSRILGCYEGRGLRNVSNLLQRIFDCGETKEVVLYMVACMGSNEKWGFVMKGRKYEQVK